MTGYTQWSDNDQPPARVVLVDDHPLFRRGVAELLTESGRFEVLAAFDSAAALLGDIETLKPDLALLDLHMPGGDGLSLLPQLKAMLPDLRVVMLTASDDSDHLLQAIQSGADGYLLKETDAELILQRLEGVLEGKVALDDEALILLTQRLREPAPSAPQQSEALNEITLRERQTLSLIAAGMSNKLIARELGISDSTVKVYVKALLRKLNLHSRLELAAWVHAHPEVDLEVEP
ncbi:Nitrate/nitrite response regulator protein [Marinobacterium lacunae]|uniref:Nitrate/nitrite response regulator protein n=1 Tax=Marinobacterium lacunae TaxID=1232683 RepID=A0A081G077_9GAMM|nr:response regulator [Marinobacterium lacunae]KEA64182.1 Nitrate/nitrite response regulator protein [Marinobacterium lacunae]MBR9885425.1 response regulator [Oceanospirillales bacterium]